MKTYWLKTKTWLPQPRANVFEFFSDPRNLDRLTPGWLKFEILAGSAMPVHQGTLLDYRLRIRGIPIRWQSEICLWQPPRRFIDRQIKGPYALWVHEHTFEEHENGTVVGDNVEYAVAGGRLVQKLLVAPDLRRIFAHRHKILQQIFNLNQLAPAAPVGGTGEIGL